MIEMQEEVVLRKGEIDGYREPTAPEASRKPSMPGKWRGRS